MAALRRLLTSLVPKLVESLHIKITHRFNEPTFIKTLYASVSMTKIKSIEVLISNELTKLDYQLSGEDFAGYIKRCKNVIEGTEK